MTLPVSAASGLHLTPIAVDERVDLILRHVQSGGHHEGGDFLSFNLPTMADRQLLTSRSQVILSALKAWNAKEVAESVLEMLSCWRDQMWVGSGDDKRRAVTKFVQELKGIPTWAVQRACDTIRMGNAPAKFEISLSFPPSTIQVRLLAESYTKQWRDELIGINDALRAKKPEPVISPEERAAVAGGLNDLARGMRERLSTSDGKGLSEEATRAKLIEQIGQEAFDAIPDAPRRQDFWQGVRVPT